MNPTINITCETDVRLNVTLMHQGEVIMPQLIDNLQAYLISGIGVRTPLQANVKDDYIKIDVPWEKGRLGCHSLMLKGYINGLAWAAVGKAVIRYTSATEKGDDNVTLQADAYDVTMEVGYHYSDSPIARVEATIDSQVGEPEVDIRYAARVLSLAFRNIKGNGIASIIKETDNTGDGAVNTWRINLDNGQFALFSLQNGSRGNGIASITPVSISQEDGGISTWSINETDGRSTLINIQNGHTGRPGPQGDSFQPIQDVSGLVLAHTLGQDNTKAMSQKGITDIVLEPVQTYHHCSKIGSYVKVPDGAEASGDNYKVSEYIPLMGTDKISSPDVYVSSSSASAIASFAFYDAMKNFIDGAAVVGAQADVPNGAAYVRCSLQKTTANCRILHYGVSKQVFFEHFLPRGLRNSIADDYIEQTCSLTNGYVAAADGANGSGAAYRRTAYIPLDGEYKVACDNVFSTSSSTVIAAFAFYDANKVFISSIPGNLQYTEVSVPTGARFMKMSTTSSYSTLTLRKYGTSKRDIYDRLPEAGEMEALQNVVNSPIQTSHPAIAKKCYITSTGEESASSGSWRASPYIELKGEVKLSCNGYTTAASSSVVMHMAFYDSNKTFISAISAAAVPSVITPPANAKYVRMSAKPGDNGSYDYDGVFLLTRYGTSKQDIYDKIKNLEAAISTNSIDLEGKTVAFIGDSITKGAYGVTAGKNYHAVFASLTGCTDVNLGENSAVYVSNPSGGNSSHPRLIDKVTSANLSSADMVVVFAGTNDFSYDSKAIGSHFAEETITPNSRIGSKKRVPPSDTDTFSGAVHELILAIRAIIGEKPMLIMTPLNRGRTSASTYNPNTAECNANGDYLTDFVDALKDIGRFYSIPVFETGAVFNVDPTKKVGTGQSAYFYDTLHPNDAGHERLAKLLYKFIANNLVV